MTAEQPFSISSMLEEVLLFDEAKYYPTRITPYHFQGDRDLYKQFRASLEQYYLLRQRELSRGESHIVLSSSPEYQRCLASLKHWLQMMDVRDSDRDLLESEESAAVELRQISDYFYTHRISFGLPVPDCDEFRLLDRGFHPRPIVARRDSTETHSLRQDQFFERAAANLARTIIREDANQQRRRVAATTLLEARKHSQADEGASISPEGADEPSRGGLVARAMVAGAGPQRGMLGRGGANGQQGSKIYAAGKRDGPSSARTRAQGLPRGTGQRRAHPGMSQPMGLLRESPSHVYPPCSLFLDPPP